jgi:glycosyltransferase involved in cell wall biosynthesis
MKKLVSILIPAYNAEKTVAESIQSALNQTWPWKEIVVIDDGSTDRTAEVVQQFGSRIRFFQMTNRGQSAALNYIYKQSNGDYFQELDSDDLMAPDKIEKQLAARRPGDNNRIVFSSPWAPFYHRSRTARFVRNSLWEDLSPAEWLYRKLNENLHMQNATWLVSREVVEAAGPWDEDLKFDQDGEYFARVLLASEGTRFVPGTGIYYRDSGVGSISFIGRSNVKKDSLLRSMKLHMQYLRSLEDSERVRKACVTYMQNWFHFFHPSRPDIVSELESLAEQMGGKLEEPRLRWKYAWIKPIFGARAADWTQQTLPQMRASLTRSCDRMLYGLDARREPRPVPSRSGAAQEE